MSHVPDYVKNFLTALPTAWDDTKFISGYPGRHAIVARKKGSRWYVSGINATDQPLNLTLNLSFAGDASGTMITDANDGNSFQQKEITREGRTSFPLSIISKGGFVMRFE